MRARYYDPEVGRFISEDPIGFDGGDVNLMAYVQNNPINRKDSPGLFWDGIDFGNYRYPGIPAGGVSLEFSTINPFSSGGGGTYGLNLQYTSSGGWHLYTYATPNNVNSYGFSPGVSLTANIATGSGNWTGPFKTAAGNYGLVTGGFFRSSDAQSNEGYVGIFLGGSVPFPAGVGVTTTKYNRMFPDRPCK